MNTFCGSPPYAAPELFCCENYVGGPVDIWALGILLYFMVVGRMPFKGQNVPTLKTNIIAGVYQVPKFLSKECADLIGRFSKNCSYADASGSVEFILYFCLTEGIIRQSPQKRLTISSILSSDWLKGVSLPSPSDADQNDLLAPTVKKSGELNAQYSIIEQTTRER